MESQAQRPETGEVRTVKIATAGDIHCRDTNRDQIIEAFAGLDRDTDLVLLAGDLTSHGTPEEAAILADAVGPLDCPVYTVMGNHDWHADRVDEITEVLEGAGITVLERRAEVRVLREVEVGVVGLKGFIGGFAPEHLPDFGEPLLRDVYAETTADIEALNQGMREIETCGIRLVLMHYSPTQTTLEGEPPGIHVFLGSDRLAAPILEHRPDAVFHGHAHAGTLAGSIEDVGVYNVSVPVLKKDFHEVELQARQGAPGPIH